MDRELKFIENFQSSLYLLLKTEILDFDSMLFKLSPIDEEYKPKGLGGDFLRSRHWSRISPDFNKSDWTFNEVLDILQTGFNNFPLWVELQHVDDFVEVRFSKRYRKYRDLHNKEFDFPPFRVL